MQKNKNCLWKGSFLVKRMDISLERKVEGSKGEDKLYDLQISISEKFLDLFNEEYHPNVYAIRATQVSCV